MKQFPIPENGVRVVGNKIFYANEPNKIFAELKYFTPAFDNSYRGIAIIYHSTKEEVWIYPEEGWQVCSGDRVYKTISEIQNVLKDKKGNAERCRKFEYNRMRFNGFSVRVGDRDATKSTAVLTWAYDVKISEDGQTVHYKTPGFFFDSTHEYSIF